MLAVNCSRLLCRCVDEGRSLYSRLREGKISTVLLHRRILQGMALLAGKLS